MNTLGQNIKAARLAAGLTQADLAELTFVSPGAVSHYECNRVTPSAETLVRISVAVGVSVEDLMSGKQAETGKVRSRVKRFDDFPEIDEDDRLLLRRIWHVIVEWRKNKK